jgi:MFS transporter, DHA1 family, multidrug resistance protein
MIIGIFGYAITMLMFGLATRLWMLFAARIISGILSSATSPTTLAYIGDSTAEKDRSSGMGILGAAGGLGTIFGPGLGGLLAGQSYAVPFFIAAGMSFLAMLLVVAFLPETHLRRPADLGKKDTLTSVLKPDLIREVTKAARRALSGQSLSAVRPIFPLLVMVFLSSFALTAFFGIFGLYALKRFAYGPQEVGVILMMVGLVSAVVQVGLTGPLARRWGEVVVIRFSLLVTAAGFVSVVLAGSFVYVILASAAFTLGASLLTPAAMALTSREAPMEQGAAMGLSNSFVSLGRIGGPTVAGFLFDADPVYPFLGCGAILLAGFGLSLLVVKENRAKTPNPEPIGQS